MLGRRRRARRDRRAVDRRGGVRWRTGRRRHRRRRFSPARRNRQRADEDRKSTSELQSLMRISYAVFCLKKKTKQYLHPVTQSKIVSPHVLEKKHTSKLIY